jgi:hypothetical protein
MKRMSGISRVVEATLCQCRSPIDWAIGINKNRAEICAPTMGTEVHRG